MPRVKIMLVDDVIRRIGVLYRAQQAAQADRDAANGASRKSTDSTSTLVIGGGDSDRNASDRLDDPL